MDPTNPWQRKIDETVWGDNKDALSRHLVHAAWHFTSYAVGYATSNEESMNKDAERFKSHWDGAHRAVSPGAPPRKSSNDD